MAELYIFYIESFKDIYMGIFFLAFYTGFGMS